LTKPPPSVQFVHDSQGVGGGTSCGKVGQLERFAPPPADFLRFLGTGGKAGIPWTVFHAPQVSDGRLTIDAPQANR
jgi:hypothetical protein